MFRDLLQQVVDQTEGGVASLLMGYDGIAVEQYVREEGLADIEAVGMELSVVLAGVRRAIEMLNAGATEEIAIRAERFTTVVRMVHAEYFVATVLKPQGNLGKARYLLRCRADGFHNALS